MQALSKVPTTLGPLLLDFIYFWRASDSKEKKSCAYAPVAPCSCVAATDGYLVAHKHTSHDQQPASTKNKQKSCAYAKSRQPKAIEGLCAETFNVRAADAESGGRGCFARQLAKYVLTLSLCAAHAESGSPGHSRLGGRGWSCSCIGSEWRRGSGPGQAQAKSQAARGNISFASPCILHVLPWCRGLSPGGGAWCVLSTCAQAHMAFSGFGAFRAETDRQAAIGDLSLAVCIW